jgi:surface carbohydrate biosynthesis protein (TIGR04326 family)
LPKRLAAKQVRVDIMIDEFENMVTDKLLNLGFRKYSPQTKIVGFQHGALFPLLLCNFVTAAEAKFAPLPDRVVCNGEFFRSVLVNEGLPARLVRVGPALRYDHLSQLVSDRGSVKRAKGNVLVPLPLVLDSAVELLTKVLSAVESVKGVRVLLKVHPMSSAESLLRSAKVTGLPPNVEFVSGTMAELLEQSALVIALSSSTVHEALAAGVPVLVVGREAALDINPLGWYADLKNVVRSAEELRTSVIRMLSLSPAALEAYRVQAQQLLSSSFAPVNDRNLSAFVEGLVTPPVVEQAPDRDCKTAALSVGGEVAPGNSRLAAR